MFFDQRNIRTQNKKDDEVLKNVVAEGALKLGNEKRPETAGGSQVWISLIHVPNVETKCAKIKIKKSDTLENQTSKIGTKNC